MNNQLTSLIVDGLPNLWFLQCTENQLTSLEVGKLIKLTVLNLRFNYMYASALNSIFTSLRTVSGYDYQIYIGYNGPNYDDSGTSECNKSIAENKGWTVYY